jgi:hypothetical protein
VGSPSAGYRAITSASASHFGRCCKTPCGKALTPRLPWLARWRAEMDTRRRSIIRISAVWDNGRKTGWRHAQPGPQASRRHALQRTRWSLAQPTLTQGRRSPRSVAKPERGRRQFVRSGVWFRQPMVAIGPWQSQLHRSQNDLQYAKRIEGALDTYSALNISATLYRGLTAPVVSHYAASPKAARADWPHVHGAWPPGPPCVYWRRFGQGRRARRPPHSSLLALSLARETSLMGAKNS